MIVSGSSPGRTFCERTERSEVGLDAELPKVMVDVLMQQDGPLVGGEAAEERVGVRGAACGAGGGELGERAVRRACSVAKSGSF